MVTKIKGLPGLPPPQPKKKENMFQTSKNDSLKMEAKNEPMAWFPNSQ